MTGRVLEAVLFGVAGAGAFLGAYTITARWLWRRRPSPGRRNRSSLSQEEDVWK